MLIEFSVTNFRSIRERQVLSMVANYRDSDLPSNLIELDLPGLRDVSILKSAAIYGANASGKTNLLLAVRFMRHLVMSSATEIKPDEPIDVSPFLLHEKCSESPSEFEVVFVHENIRYQYGFSVDKSKIHSEWLYSYPEGRQRRVFERFYDPQKDVYRYGYGGHFRRDKELETKTRSNALFLSVGAQFNSDQLIEVYRWFRTWLRTLNLSAQSYGLTAVHTAADIQENKKLRSLFSNLLKRADVGIDDVVVRSMEFDPDNFPHYEELPDSIKEQIKDEEILDIKFIHKTCDSRKTVEIGFENESAGTQKFFSLIGPMHDTLSNGYCVFIDEIGASMHPLLTRELVRMINDSQQNAHGAQLVYTTHDTTLLDENILRRDQFWITEKANDGSTRLTPLSDYSPRKREALQRGYMAGRYGGIPMLTDGLKFE